MTEFWNAVRERDHEKVGELLANKRIDLTAYVIRWSAKLGSGKIMALLLADPTVDPTADGTNLPLVEALLAENWESAKVLLRDPRVFSSCDDIKEKWLFKVPAMDAGFRIVRNFDFICDEIRAERAVVAQEDKFVLENTKSFIVSDLKAKTKASEDSTAQPTKRKRVEETEEKRPAKKRCTVSDTK